jgi:hypothetical protein
MRRDLIDIDIDIDIRHQSARHRTGPVVRVLSGLHSSGAPFVFPLTVRDAGFISVLVAVEQ